jgi:septum formation protein
VLPAVYYISVQAMKPIVLASSSPRRRELLAKAGLKFVVDSLETEELMEAGVDPVELTKSIAQSKARSAAGRHPGCLVITADTIGSLDGALLGKPRDAEHARRMLEMMSGRRHEVVTAFTILDTDTDRSVTRAVVTGVRFRKLSHAEIDKYVASGEPLDKAGAYGIQGLGASLVDSVEGDFCNVIGLPVSALLDELCKFGIEAPHPDVDCAADSPAR